MTLSEKNKIIKQLKKITISYLNNLKSNYNKKYPIPKWINFCEIMINNNWDVFLKRSKTTVSKYIFIKKDKKILKIRFSNHKANYYQEKVINDCDYYVGIGNLGIITTEELIEKIKKEN